MKKLFALLILAVAVALPLAQPMRAAAAATINYNNVISDVVFDDARSMTAAQINTFLNRFPNSCLSTNNGYSFAAPTGYSPDSGFTYGSNVSAGTVIYDAAQAYDINPQVLLATTQKEEGLVEGNGSYGCSALAFSAGMGYACTDSGTASHDYSGIQMYVKNGNAVTSVSNTCVNSSSYVGFSRQVINAAWLFAFARHRSEGDNNWYINKTNWDNSDDLEFCYRGYMEDTGSRKVYQCPDDTSHPSDPYVAWSGQYSIDGTKVTIKDGATAALYYYTPHLHGQELFFDNFSSWFGSTTTTYTAMTEPRWMQLKTNTYKVNPGTGENVDGQLSAGTQIYFPTKITVDGVAYLRTEHDTELGYNKVIPLSDLEEVPVNYISMGTPRWMKTKVALYKQNPVTGKNTGSKIPAGTVVFFPTKFDIGGQTYAQTEHDSEAGTQDGILLSDLQNASVSYTSLLKPRWMVARTNTYMQAAKSSDSGPTITAGTQLYFNYKTTINGTTFVRDGLPSSTYDYLGVPLSDVTEISFVPTKPARWMQLKADTYKDDPITGGTVDGSLSAGTQIYFSSKIDVNGVTYMRTQHDTDAKAEKGIPLSDLEDAPIDYVSMGTPRWMKTKYALHKIDPLTGQSVGPLVAAGTKIYFPTKIDMGGVTYLRTQHDTDAGATAGIPLSELE